VNFLPGHPVNVFGGCRGQCKPVKLRGHSNLLKIVQKQIMQLVLSRQQSPILKDRKEEEEEEKKKKIE
jgi:hypothetical protein